MSDQSRRRRYPGVLVWLIAALALAIALLVASAAAARDYTRSCSATMSFGPSGGRFVSHVFTGQGTVGSYMPNTARERARRNIDECLDANFANPHRLLPQACTEANQVYNYPFNRLHQEMVAEVCRANPDRSRFRMNVNVTYDGDTGCIARPNIWMRTVASNYEVICPGRDYEDGVNRPGMDYTNFTPDAPSWQLCSQACQRDRQCNAWTFVRPGFGQGPGGRCWLKTGIPAPRNNRCCVSGVVDRLQ